MTKHVIIGKKDRPSLSFLPIKFVIWLFFIKFAAFYKVFYART